MFDDYLASTSNMELVSGGEKLILLDREPPMTIIAAMWESEDSILIGADSGETETTTNLRLINNNKLQRYSNPSIPLAWGAAGNPAIGIDGFAEWLRNHEPFTTWQGLKANCEDKMAELVGRRNALRIKMNIPYNFISRDDASVLLVGCLENSLRMLEINQEAIGYFIAQRFHTIGMNPAVIATNYRTIEQTRTPTLEDFARVLDISARSFPQCDPPIHIWRVTREGIIEL